jgi:hypothetical protein
MGHRSGEAGQIYLEQLVRTERNGLAHDPLSFAYNWFHLFSQAGHVGDLIYLLLTAQYSNNNSGTGCTVRMEPKKVLPSGGVFQ